MRLTEYVDSEGYMIDEDGNRILLCGLPVMVDESLHSDTQIVFGTVAECIKEAEKKALLN